MSSSSHSESCICDDCTYNIICDQHIQSSLLSGAATIEYPKHIQKHCIKRPMRDSSLSGHQWVWELWHGHDRRFFENKHMRKPMMRKLIEVLVNIGGLPCAPKNVTLEESMAIFLLVVGQGATYPVIEERLQRSSETVSNHFHMVLKAICKLGQQMICPIDPNSNNDPVELMQNPSVWPIFKGCIGAIDGTHISVHLPDSKKVPRINHKGMTTTNVLAICDFNMCITFAAVGMEGLMHDNRVLSEAMRQTGLPFPFPPSGKYYLADAGYPLMRSFLTPYRRTRYHLPKFRQNRTFRNKNKIFNYKHSSLRSVIERTFGVLKKRWRVLNSMPMMSLKTQISIIWACITLHNFIRRYDEEDLDLLGIIPEEDDNLSSRLRDNSTVEWMTPTTTEARIMENFRDMIRDSLATSGF